MRKNKFRFTNRALSQLQAHATDSPSRSAEYSDAEVIGLRVLVNKQGRKYFYFRFVFEGQKRAAKLGEFPALEVAEARTLALEMRAKVDRGINPQESDSSAGPSLTFEAFGKNEYMPFARQTKRSAHDDECRLRVQIYPRFGTQKMSDIQTREIQQFHADMKESHCAATANRHLSLISRMYKLAVQWGRVERNPCIGISKFKENNQRQRFLTPEEIQRMYKAMESEPNRTAVAALKFLLLTGARREEALKARWENVDLDNGVWFLPQTKSGRGRYVQLNSEAQALLRALPRDDGSAWLFPSKHDSAKPIYSPRDAFDRVLTAAGIEHLRLHDLRHTYASLAINAGVSLSVIQGLLHHQSPVQTMRYSHLMNSTLRSATESIAEAVSKAIMGSPNGGMDGRHNQG
ncbi:tyrosine-type recombinase/integrase [Noviherbaspirillum sp. 1P10PC]|uniref:tyrosine-type recombinase/integrase n=1 Tax=Noviherbaspirillum sp. 1P10PC TaxID=3132292 RepID=UPI0039A13C3C